MGRPSESSLSGDPCWVGPQGDGCPHHIFGLRDRESINEDAQLIARQLSQWEETKPNSPFVGHLRALMARHEQVMNTLDKLEAKERDGGQ
jgi:hypothetical protein